MAQNQNPDQALPEDVSPAAQDAMDQLARSGEGTDDAPVGPNDGPAPAAGSQSGSPKGHKGSDS
ncbi:MAG: hypothetical protein EOO24_08150 [Comamonadaceae bacterium]|nr:MAG: hypothetical protein EOO24_08150 [Comamonadaceae bacterium]